MLVKAALDVLGDTDETRAMRAAALAYVVGPASKKNDFQSRAPPGFEPVAADLATEIHSVVVRDAARSGGPVWVIRPDRAAELSSKLSDRIRQATKVWLIHGGRSNVWQLISNDLRGQMNLGCIEFSDVGAAGATVTERVSGMVVQCRLAVAVMSCEDKVEGGKCRARQNVIHEIGLAQGIMGVGRVVVVLQDGVEAFTNMSGVIYVPLKSEDSGDVRSMLLELRGVVQDRLTK